MCASCVLVTLFPTVPLPCWLGLSSLILKVFFFLFKKVQIPLIPRYTEVAKNSHSQIYFRNLTDSWSLSAISMRSSNEPSAQTMGRRGSLRLILPLIHIPETHTSG